MAGRSLYVFFWTSVTALSLLLPSAEAAGGDQPVIPTKVSRAPLVDGNLRDACWEEATEYAGFSVLRAQQAARPLTKFRVVYDENRLYFGIECLEPNMAGLVTKTTENDNGRVWADDAVEIFLDPSGRRDDYFHFIFNTRCARFDEKLTHGGGIVTWNADWDVAVRKQERSWTAEVAIPFYSLEIIPSVNPKSWRFNIVRSRRAGEKPLLTTWAPLKLTYAEPDRFVPLGPVHVDFTPFCYAAGKPKRESVMQKGVLDTTVEIAVTNATGGERRVQVEGWLVGPAGHVQVRASSLMLPRGETQPARFEGFAVTERGRHTFYLVLNDEKTRHMSSHPMKITFTPIEIVLARPSYRATIFATQEIAEIRMDVKVGLSESDRPCKSP